MRTAALYDIHGNLPALEAVLDDLRRSCVDRVIIGGDVFPGPMSSECLALLLEFEIPVQFIRGNGDRAVLDLVEGREPADMPKRFQRVIGWVAEQMLPEHRDVIAGWPATARMTVGDLSDVLFCHATPRSDTEIFTRETPGDVLQPIFDEANARLVICGHTHMQFDRMIGETRVVNAGSVGMPFADPGAYWLLLGPEVTLKRTLYDFDTAAERIRATRYPEADDFVHNNILQPPTERTMLDRFAQIAALK